jgi:hypothetical protein
VPERKSEGSLNRVSSRPSHSPVALYPLQRGLNGLQANGGVQFASLIPYPRTLDALKPIFMRLLHPSRAEHVPHDNLEPHVWFSCVAFVSQESPTAHIHRKLMRDPVPVLPEVSFS